MNPNQPDVSKTEEPLGSWKEIGAYLQRNEATARRWEREEGLPVHRHPHKTRSSVYAYPSEIDAWKAARKLATQPVAHPWWRNALAGVTAMLCLVMVGNGVRPRVASAQQPKQTARQVWTGSGIESSQIGANGSVTPDGRYLSFVDLKTGDLAIRDLSTETNRRLTNTASWEKPGEYVQNSVISPDGVQIAYSWFMSGDTTWELRILPMRGGEPRTLHRSNGTADRMFPVAWTPDRRQLLVYRFLPDDSSQIGMLNVENGAYRALKSSWRFNRPRLSPDGRWVAYGGLPDQQTQAWDVYILATDGSQEMDVVQGPAYDVPVEWSPDGSRLYFRSNRSGSVSLYSIPVSSGRAAGPVEMVRREWADSDPLGMTRGGALYYLSQRAERSNVYMAEIGPGGTLAKPPALVSERFVDMAVGASLSPDGKSLAYIGLRIGLENEVVVRTIETGKELELHTELKLTYPSGRGPAWFPDGHSLLVVTYDHQKGGSGFVRLNLPSGETEILHHVANELKNFALSPDGKTLFYTEFVSPPSTRLVRYDLVSKRETELGSGKYFSELAVSPDGTRLAYQVSENPVGYLAVMSSSGGPAKEIFRAANLNKLEWTPDGNSLLFTKYGSLWRVSAAGGPSEQLIPPLSGGIDTPMLHPDGKRFFYTLWEPRLSEVWALENFIPAAPKR